MKLKALTNILTYTLQVVTCDKKLHNELFNLLKLNNITRSYSCNILNKNTCN